MAVSADIFRDGHEKLRAVVKYKAPGGRRWLEAPMHAVDAHINGVRWAGEFEVTTTGAWQFTVEAWTDRWATWHDELRRKVEADLDEDLSGELSEGVVLLHKALERCKGPAKRSIQAAHEVLSGKADMRPQVRGRARPRAVRGHGGGPGAGGRHPARQAAPARGRPRQGPVRRLVRAVPEELGRPEGGRGARPDIADLGFDVLYLLPFHPIGRKNRKGRNNSLTAGPDDPGSPYAIGAAEGGHFDVHPELGTEQDVRDLCAAAHHHGLDVCLDIALNASADHPWLTEHPEWFQQRPDGTLKYAENPPKRYQDIYNFNWDTPAWRELWDAWRDVFLHWVEAGIKFYRVDNPHTKPFPFWEWLIKEVHAVDRDVVFLAEAFTRRSVMRELGKLGFTQSYTYFTWKNSRYELTEYVNELAWGEEREYFRPNFFPVTPDILHAYLVHGGPPAFVSRLVLAATLGPSYGIYSGYEHFENVPVREGSEEYLNSEKYEVRQRSLDGPLLPMIRRMNEVRRENPALQHLSNVYWLETQNDSLMAYAKQKPGNTVICIVNLDPHNAQEGLTVVPAQLGLPARLRRRGPVHRRPLRLADRRQLRPPRPPRRPDARVAGPRWRPAPATTRATGSRPSRCGSRPRSSTRSTRAAFFDANGDGSGDFRGLIEKLDYLQWLGVDCIWLLPFFKSPLRDGGYDIADFFTIQPDYGTVDDVRDFIEAAHQRGIRVIADLVMNHTSSDHPWFQESRSSPGQPQARLVRVVGHDPPLRGGADHLHRHRDVELDVGRPGRRLLLAPLLLPPARPQLRQPRGAGGDARGPALLAGPRHGRLPARRRALPVRARRAPTARTCPRRTTSSSACAPRSTPTTRTACCWPRPTSGRPTSSSTSATATSATWPSTSP